MGMERTRKQETQTLKQSLFPLLALALFGGGTFDLFKQQDRQALFQAVRGLGGGGGGSLSINANSLQPIVCRPWGDLWVICREKAAKKINPVVSCLKFVTDGLHLCWKTSDCK